MTELDQRNARITMIYELRLIFSKDSEKSYTAKEICEILDKLIKEIGL